MMKIGFDANHTIDFNKRGVHGTLDLARELGFDGIFVKTIADLSHNLDFGELREVKAHAQSLGLFLQSGIGRVNPYNTSESPDIRALAKGDYKKSIEMMIIAAREIEITELWADTATSIDKQHYQGYFSNDRFRTDVSWIDQLDAIEKFLKMLTPVLKDVGSRINIETHEEITSFEVVRIVETIGPDMIGITFDPGNVLLRCESPMEAVKRVAPYTHLTHLKDASLHFNENGLFRQVLPCGKGILDWEIILSELGKYNSSLELTIEDHKGAAQIPIFNDDWLSCHPDLTAYELSMVVELAEKTKRLMALAEIPDPSLYEILPFEEDWIDRLKSSSFYLRNIIRELRFQD